MQNQKVKKTVIQNRISTFLDHEICQVRFPKGGTSVITEMGFDAANWSKDIAILLGTGFSRISTRFEKLRKTSRSALFCVQIHRLCNLQVPPQQAQTKSDNSRKLPAEENFSASIKIINFIFCSKFEIKPKSTKKIIE